MAAATPPPRDVNVYLRASNDALQVLFANYGASAPFTIAPQDYRIALVPFKGADTTVVPSTTTGPQISVTPSADGPFAEERFAFTNAYIAEMTFPLPATIKSGLYHSHLHSSKPWPRLDDSLIPGDLYISTARETPDSGLARARAEYLNKTVYLVSGDFGPKISCRPYHPPPTPTPAPTATPTPVGATPSPTPNGRQILLNMMRSPQVRARMEKEIIEQRKTDAAFAQGAPWRVVAISRSIGDSEDGYFDNPDQDFLVVDPLIVELRYAGNASTARTILARQYCGTAFADPWEGERFLWRRSPFDHPEWPARMMRAVKEGHIIVGMTHEMVAAINGYPAAYGTVAELNRLTQWYYNDPTPFDSTVHFKGDRVVRYDPPGDLP